MTVLARNIIGPSLSDIYPPFKAKMDEFRLLMNTDKPAAEKAFAEAQLMAQAFYAGVRFSGAAQ